MQPRRKRPRDPAQLAKLMIDIASGEVDDREPESPNGKDAAAISLGRRGGLKGGKARAAKMTPERRAEIARTHYPAAEDELKALLAPCAVPDDNSYRTSCFSEGKKVNS
jgi:hypothetical protein